METIRKVITVPFDKDGNLIEGSFSQGIIGEALTHEDAVLLAKSKGYEIADFDSPDRIPGELIDEPVDAFSVGVIST